MKKLNTRQIALNGVVAGLYAAITILTASFAYGDIQFRIADAMCLLVVIEPSLTVGLTLGLTPHLHILSQLILIGLMYMGRVGGLTLIYATVSNQKTIVAILPQEHITVG